MHRTEAEGGGRRHDRSPKTREEIWAHIEAKTQEGYTANPFHVLIDTMIMTRDLKLKVQGAAELKDNLLPKPKAMELAGEVAHIHHLAALAEMSDTQLLELLAASNGHSAMRTAP